MNKRERIAQLCGDYEAATEHVLAEPDRPDYRARQHEAWRLMSIEMVGSLVSYDLAADCYAFKFGRKIAPNFSADRVLREAVIPGGGFLSRPAETL